MTTHMPHPSWSTEQLEVPKRTCITAFIIIFCLVWTFCSPRKSSPQWQRTESVTLYRPPWKQKTWKMLLAVVLFKPFSEALCPAIETSAFIMLRKAKFHWNSNTEKRWGSVQVKTFTHTGVYTGQNPRNVQMISALITQAQPESMLLYS